MSERARKFIEDFILPWETEYNSDGSARVEHDPDDPGGTTKYGIDQRSHANVDVALLTKDNAVDIYTDEWNECGVENMPAKLGESYFNVRVNAGAGRAQKCLTVSNGDPSKFIDELERFYNALADEKPRLNKYRKGWLNRIRALREYLEL